MRCCTDAQLGLTELCEAVEGNFLEIPFPEGTFDGAYAIEATCHAAQVTATAPSILAMLGQQCPWRPHGFYSDGLCMQITLHWTVHAFCRRP